MEEIVLKRYMSLSQFVLIYFHEVGRTEERAVRLMLCHGMVRRFFDSNNRFDPSALKTTR